MEIFIQYHGINHEFVRLFLIKIERKIVMYIMERTAIMVVVFVIYKIQRIICLRIISL